MRAYAAVCAVVGGLSAADALNLRAKPYYESAFSAWQARYDVEFPDAKAYDHALQNFADNDDRISTHDAQEAGYKMAHNAYSHLSWGEFRELKGIGQAARKNVFSELSAENSAAAVERRALSSPADVADLPTEVDWVSKGAVTNVKNQGQCGSCWSFSATGSLEGAYYLKTGKLVTFSEQELVDCDVFDSGCNGGLMDFSFHWIQKNGGLCSEDDYPYTADPADSCNESACVTVPGSGVKAWVDVEDDSMAALMAAVAERPVSVAIEADEMDFQFYSGGVLTGNCGTSLDHGVLAVGYGTTEEGQMFWKVKNSWGADWGMGGYIMLERGAKQDEGKCGILASASYPVLED